MSLVLLAFGVLVPWRQGFGLFDPLLLIAYALMGFLFTTPAVPAVLDPRPDGAGSLFARVSAAGFYGWAVSVVLYSVGVVVVNSTHKFGQVILPKGYALAAIFGAALIGCVAAAALTAWLSLQFSPAVAKSLIRIAFLGLLAAIIVRSKAAGEDLLDSLTMMTTVDSLPMAGAKAAALFAVSAALFLVLGTRTLARKP
jgi:hypothetical protein